MGVTMNKFGIIIIALSLITGCATTSIQSTSVSTNTVLTPEQGIVVVQVVNNTERLAPLHKDWTEVIAVRLDNVDAKIKAAQAKGGRAKWEHDFYSLTPSKEGVVNSQIFVGAMPEGEYIISTLYSFYTNGDMSSWISMPVYYSAGRFNVEKKRLTNLGSLIFQPLLSIKEKTFWSNKSSQKAFVTRLEEQQPLSQYVSGRFSKLAKQIDVSDPIGWQKDELNPFRISLGDITRNNAYGDIAISLDKHAKGALPSRFGQLKLLNTDNSWQQYDLPTNNEMLSALEVDDEFYIGSEKGILYYRDFMSKKDWQKLSPVSANEAIVWFGKGASHYYAITQTNLTYWAYSFSHPKNEWQRIGSFVTRKNKFLNYFGGLFPIITSNGSLRVFIDEIVRDYNQDTSRWKLTKGIGMVKLAQLNDSTLVGLEVSQWDGIGDQVVSIDDGNTWTIIARSLKKSGDRKADSSLPTKLADNSFVSLGRKSRGGSSRLSIMSNKFEHLDNRKTWKFHYPPKDRCETMLPQLTNGMNLYFLCEQGQVVSTNDFGKTWNIEVDIDLAGMQSQYEILLNALKESASNDEKNAKQNKKSNKEPIKQQG